MRSIAERLSYMRRTAQTLNPLLFDEDNMLKDEIRKKIQGIVDAFLEYAQLTNVRIIDVRLLGSNAAYNYTPESDLDIHIVTDLSEISDPETIARLYFDSVKKNFKDSYDIKIKGIEVEIYVEDINSSAISNGVYSVKNNKWIHEPTTSEDPTDEQMSQAEEIERKVIYDIKNAENIEELQSIVDNLYLLRKDSLAHDGENGAGNLAFKSIRNKGILVKVKDILRLATTSELSLESKEIRENHQIPKGSIQYTINCTDNEGILKKILDAIMSLGKRGHSCNIVIDPGAEEQKFFYDGDGSDRIQSIFKDESIKESTIPLKTLKGSIIRRNSKYGVGKEIGGQIYFHKNYIDRIVPDKVYEDTRSVLLDLYPDFKYNCCMYDKNKPTLLRYDEASDFDTAREPSPGKMITINAETEEATVRYSPQIWHHKWLWVTDDYKGFDVQESYEWSQEWLSKLGDPASGYKDKWTAQLEKVGLE